MYKDGYLSYNPEATDEAIYSCMKAENISKNLNQTNSISVPDSFKSKGKLNSVLNNINTTFNNINNLPTELKRMKNTLEDYIGDDTLSELTESMRGYNYVELENGARGYLYVPEGYTSIKGLPLVVYLAGQGVDSTDPSKGKSKALGYLLNNGLKLDAVAFVPIGRSDNWEAKSTLELIDNVANLYQLDKNRISLVGYSWGACVGYEMIVENPDYFSAFVPFGGYFRLAYSEEATQTLTSSSTKFIIYHSKGDPVYDRCVKLYETLKSNDAQVVMYEFTGQGSGHHNINEVFSTEMLDDLINIRKDEEYDNLPEEIIKIDVVEANTMSAKYELDNNVDNENKYYVRISDEKTNTNENSLDENEEEITDLEVSIMPGEKAPEETEPVVSNDSTAPEETAPVVSNDSTAPEETAPVVPNDSTAPEETAPVVPNDSTAPEETAPVVSNDSTVSKNPAPAVSNDSTVSKNPAPAVSNNPTVSKNPAPAVSNNPTVSKNPAPAVSNNPTVSEVNILPENKFSKVLPEITHGSIESMEISKSFVSYKISNVGESVYNDYISRLQEFGYEFINNKWVKNNCEIMLNFDSNAISLTVNINE